MYNRPPNVVTTSVALAAGAANVVILAAPGGPRRYRVVGVMFGINRVATGVADLHIQDGAGIIIARGLGLSVADGSSNFVPNIPEPGIPCTTNSSLQFNTTSSLATGTAAVTVYYYLDNVS